MSSQPCYVISHLCGAYWRSRVTASVYKPTIVAASLNFSQSLQTNSKILSQITTQPLRFTSVPIHYSRTLPFHATVEDPRNIPSNLLTNNYNHARNQIEWTLMRNAYKYLVVSLCMKLDRHIRGCEVVNWILLA
jgi:hypothetical protein